MSTTEKRLANRYQANLRTHMHDGGDISLARADILGGQAKRMGLSVIDFAQVHAHAVAAAATDTAPDDATSARADHFFIRACEPLTAAQAALAVRQLADKKQAAAASSTVKKKLRQETAKRERATVRLKTCRLDHAVLLTQSRLMQNQLRLLSHRILMAQEEERKSISRELHDEISQILTGINVRLTALTIEATKHSGSLKGKIASTQRLVKKSVDVVHRFARELRPAMLDDLGLVPTLTTIMKEAEQRTGIQIRFTSAPPEKIMDLEGMKRTVLFRIAQESLVNITKHAKATKVDISLQMHAKTVCMEVRDDGVGFDVDRLLDISRHKRLGLIGMRERAEMVGGTFLVTSFLGQGTTITVTLPGPEARL